MPISTPNTQATRPPTTVTSRNRTVSFMTTPLATSSLLTRAAEYAPMASKPQQPSVSWPSTPMVRFSEVVMITAMQQVMMTPLTYSDTAPVSHTPIRMPNSTTMPTAQTR